LKFSQETFTPPGKAQKAHTYPLLLIPELSRAAQ
jgi:hypothetical protein